MSAVDEFPSDAFFQGLHDLEMTKWVCAAALALVLWDYLLTLEDERTFVWGRRFSFLNTLFYLNRYPIFLFQISNIVYFQFPHRLLTNRFCHIFQLAVIPAEGAFQWGVAAAVISHRLWALYSDSTFMKTVVVVTWIFSVGALLVIDALVMPTNGAAADGLPFGMRMCHSTTLKQNAWIPTLPGIGFDLFAFGLALVKIIEQRQMVAKLRTTSSTMRIFDTMAVGSAMYFVVILAGHITTLVTGARRESLTFLWVPMMLSLSSITCNRMILDLRQAGSTPVNQQHETFDRPSSAGWSTGTFGFRQPPSSGATAHPSSQPSSATRFVGRSVSTKQTRKGSEWSVGGVASHKSEDSAGSDSELLQSGPSSYSDAGTLAHSPTRFNDTRGHLEMIRENDGHPSPRLYPKQSGSRL